jgi:hypothetical protein
VGADGPPLRSELSWASVAALVAIGVAWLAQLNNCWEMLVAAQRTRLLAEALRGFEVRQPLRRSTLGVAGAGVAAACSGWCSACTRSVAADGGVGSCRRRWWRFRSSP